MYLRNFRRSILPKISYVKKGKNYDVKSSINRHCANQILNYFQSQIENLFF